MFDSKRMVSKGYTLWLIPKGESYDKFAGLIKKLANEYGGPIFVPHVTLLGDIKLTESEMIKRTSQLVKSQKAYSISLGKIAYEDYFFRTLIVLAEVIEQLQNLHDLAKKIFEMNIPPYMPHLSILYGEYPAEIKEKIIAEIGRDQTARLEAGSVHLIKGGEVKDWEIIKEFAFS